MAASKILLTFSRFTGIQRIGSTSMRYAKNLSYFSFPCAFFVSYIQYVKSVQIRSFFWSVFSRIQTEYGEILRMRENMDQKKLSIWTLFTQ